LQEAAAEEEFGAKLSPINNKRDFEALIQGDSYLPGPQTVGTKPYSMCCF
jgi:hypothetical protein